MRLCDGRGTRFNAIYDIYRKRGMVCMSDVCVMASEATRAIISKL